MHMYVAINMHNRGILILLQVQSAPHNHAAHNITDNTDNTHNKHCYANMHHTTADIYTHMHTYYRVAYRTV